MMIDPNDTGQVRSIRDPAKALGEQCDDMSAEARAEAHRLASQIREVRCRRHASAPPGARRILLVDDDHAVLRAVRRMLLEVVEFVDIAPSVASAVSLAERNSYDVMVVDYQLTNGTAKTLMQQIRAHSMRPLVWCILISGYATDHDGPALAREVGANRWLKKPLDINALHDAIHEGLAASMQARSLANR